MPEPVEGNNRLVGVAFDALRQRYSEIAFVELQTTALLKATINRCLSQSKAITNWLELPSTRSGNDILELPSTSSGNGLVEGNHQSLPEPVEGNNRLVGVAFDALRQRYSEIAFVELQTTALLKATINRCLSQSKAITNWLELPSTRSGNDILELPSTSSGNGLVEGNHQSLPEPVEGNNRLVGVAFDVLRQRYSEIAFDKLRQQYLSLFHKL